MFRLALSSHIYYYYFVCFFAFFSFRDTNRDTLVSLRPETPCGNACFWGYFLGASEFKVRNLVLWLALHIFAAQCCHEPQVGRNSCPLLRSCVIGSCHVGVWKRFSRSISLAVYCLNRGSERGGGGSCTVHGN